MRRYIFRFQGKGAIPQDTLEAIRQRDGVTVLDETARMVLVQAEEAAAQGLATELAGWSCTEEKMLARPTPWPNVRTE